MVGDGVNDVPALKAARLAIAQGTGAQIAKSVADVVLVRGEFSAVPSMVAEGRKILRNLQRGEALRLEVDVRGLPDPLDRLDPDRVPGASAPPHPRRDARRRDPGVLPRARAQLGPAARTGFLRDIASFALPAGIALGLGVVASYLFSSYVLDLSLTQARTVATSVLILVGLYLILARGLGRKRVAVSAFVRRRCRRRARRAVRQRVLRAGATRPRAGSPRSGAALAVLGLRLVGDRFVPGGEAEGSGTGGVAEVPNQ